MRGEATSELRLLVAKESSSESRSTLNGHATSATVAVAVDARLARTVAIRWHRSREGLRKSGTPSAGHTVTYNFVADRPGTFTYHAGATAGTAAPASSTCREARPAHASAAAGRARANTGPSRARAAAAHGAVNVRRSDQGPTANSRAGKPASTVVRRVDGRERGSRGMASIEAQLMADCDVIHYDEGEYGGGPPVRRLLRWAGGTLAATVLWVSRICGPRDPD